MKKFLLATALALSIISAPALGFDDTENLQGWQEDYDTIHALSNDPNPAVRECVKTALAAMETNKYFITLGEPNSNVRMFMPAANHYRENTIMPEFDECLTLAGA